MPATTPPTPASITSIGSSLTALADRSPDAVAISSARETFTYGQLVEDARLAAAALAASGVADGHRFAILSRNSATMLELMYAASLSGSVLVPLNFRLASREIADILLDSGATLVFVEDELRPLLADVEAEITTVRVDEQVQTDDYRAWRTGNGASSPRAHAPDDRSVVLQMYTTGTTGRPKGVMITEGNLLAMTAMVADVFALTPASRYLALLPMFHISGGGTPLGVLAAGGQVVLSSGTSAAVILDDLISQRITHVNLVPSLISLLLVDPATATADLSALEMLMYGAAPSSGTTIAEAMALLPHCGFVHGYGLTECTGGVTFADAHRWGDPSDEPGTVGRPVPVCELRIVDPETLLDVDRDVAGEVWVRSPQNTIGYWNRPEETAKLFADGDWLRTGDIGSIDAGGVLTLKDRLKDMIISGGENVYSAEVENVIASHPAVLAVAVYGVPHPKWGESVKAVVTLRPGHVATPEDIIEHTRTRLAHYKCPKDVEITDAMPMSGSGKILKRVLRDRDRPPHE